MKKEKTILSLISCLCLISLLTVSTAYAETDNNKSSNNVFSKIVKMFRKLVPNDQEEKNAESKELKEDLLESGSAPEKMKVTSQYEKKLDKLVEEGKITEDQKTAILAELEIIDEKMKALVDELKNWAIEQGIDESYVMMFQNKDANDDQTPPQTQGKGNNPTKE